MRCATHPGVETELRCGKCGKAVCPRCFHHTPVGVRCRDCANIRRLPTYHISPLLLFRGLIAALVAGGALGGLWGVLLPWSVGFLIGLLVGAGLGYAIGETVSRATNRRAGPPYQVLAAGGVVLAYAIRTLILAADLRGIGVLDILTDDLFGYIVLGMGIVVAISRVR